MIFVAVYRVNKNRGYTVMANFHLRDKSLSLKAVGLLSKMLSFNDGWKFSTKGLSTICKEGPDAILSALRELEKHGYLVRHRQRDGKGRMSSTIFEIYEEPQESTPEREILADYLHLLMAWRTDYAPHSPEEAFHPRFVEALQKQAQVEYLLDVLLFGETEEKADLITDYGKDVIQLEQRMAELAAADAARTKKHY